MEKDFAALPIDGWVETLSRLIFHSVVGAADRVAAFGDLEWVRMPSGLAMMVAWGAIVLSIVGSIISYAKLVLDGRDVIAAIRRWLGRTRAPSDPPPPPPSSPSPGSSSGVAWLPSRRVRQSSREIAELLGWQVIDGGASLGVREGDARTAGDRRSTERLRLFATRCERERCLVRALLADERRSVAAIRRGCPGAIRLASLSPVIACTLLDRPYLRSREGVGGMAHPRAAWWTPTRHRDASSFRAPREDG